MPLNLLFVCTRNQWRNPTAERIWRKTTEVSLRSAGTSHTARRRLTRADLRWADLIFVMEETHKSRIKSDFRDDARHKMIHVLDIPDDYDFMDPELIDLLQSAASPIIEAARAQSAPH